jgi:hypothetical protein
MLFRTMAPSLTGPDEGLRIVAGQIGVEVRDDGDLILAADSGEDGADGRVGKCGVDISCARRRRGVDLRQDRDAISGLSLRRVNQLARHGSHRSRNRV